MTLFMVVYTMDVMEVAVVAINHFMVDAEDVIIYQAAAEVKIILNKTKILFTH